MKVSLSTFPVKYYMIYSRPIMEELCHFLSVWSAVNSRTKRLTDTVSVTKYFPSLVTSHLLIPVPVRR